MIVEIVKPKPVVYPDIMITLSGDEVGLLLKLFGRLSLDSSSERLVTNIPFYPEGKEIRDITGQLYELIRGKVEGQ